jgi:DNA-binding IscR family transcriptional regulator
MRISNKCSIAIHCLIFINEYGAEKKVTSELLSLSTGCNPVTIRNILSSLKKAGLITVRFGTGGAAIALPLQEISLYQICMAVEPDAVDKMIGVHSSPSPFCPVGKNIHYVLSDTYNTLQCDVANSMKNITLHSIVDDYHTMISKHA